MSKDKSNARDIADFPRADSVDIKHDLTGEPVAVVVNPDPELVYRGVRPDKRAVWEQRGYRDNPPDRNGRPAKFRGPVDDLVVMACHKSVYEQRSKARKSLSTEQRERATRAAANNAEQRVSKAGTLRGVRVKEE